METKELNRLIKEKLGKRGIFEYKIDGMKIEDGNFSVASNGELEYEQCISVNITPLATIKNIKINIIITPNKNN